MADRSSADQASPAKFQPRYPEGYWDDAAEYLRQSFVLHHNEDYLEFLVRQVWKLDGICRLGEFGCGSGRMGLQLMPLLAPGSSYTGIDQSAKLVATGRQVWASTPWPAEFHQGSIYETPFARPLIRRDPGSYSLDACAVSGESASGNDPGDHAQWPGDRL